MLPDLQRPPRRLLIAIVIVIASVSAIGGLIQDGSGPRHKSGGSEGTGVLPYAGQPVSAPGAAHELATPTPGLVLDAQGNGVAGTQVIVTHPAIGTVALAHTDASGLFVVNLPDLAKLELALPDETLAGIDVSAGVPIMIIVP